MKINILLLFTLLILNITTLSQENPARQWPWYRGYHISGVLDNANLPETFDFKTMNNIRWKTEIPGLGLSSPVIWGNRLFVTTALSKSDNKGFRTGIFGDVTSVDDVSEHEWLVICFDKNNGNRIWERVAHRGVPAMKRHPKSTHANASVATDGKHVVAFFGSEGLYCYDFNGNLLWKKDFGVLKSVFFSMPEAQWEFASSPIIYEGKIIIQCDVLENSFVAVLDAASGKELWRVNRDEYPGWCTPNIYTFQGRKYVVVNGYKHRGAYELETGKEVWRMSGGGDIPIPSPVIGKDIIYFNSAHGKSSPILAVNASARGDITLKEGETSNDYVLWSRPRGGSYLQTLLLYRNHLYNLNWNGTINCYDPLTGEEIFSGKLGDAKSFSASPVASDGKIYAVDEEGTIYILRDGNKYELIAEIPSGEVCMSAPAITDGMIFFRTQKYLYCVGKK
ncbi:MAG TPA: PQQ-binding-like beta-propeller repeat protein [Bacteroidales bacterium]|nr:PQQ-binding-like beta-propeller repeat protein [Bacteroidales bacterium]HOK73871.1 PQQ-binding-like beta-propeller repeat protein [Bacteroidales bacterium]HOM39603.1 PQQ-binding-like beta-propeller repeat protein [Bacteroidales bacterium]HPP91649.1 PQQ-binding-like beta-propeller repeat protein [Bacteroidales bacterium]HRR15838.1 PQQ-binding-like beta-propeller repeat protein [Bacteroidales bacterium]